MTAFSSCSVSPYLLTANSHISLCRTLVHQYYRCQRCTYPHKKRTLQLPALQDSLSLCFRCSLICLSAIPLTTFPLEDIGCILPIYSTAITGLQSMSPETFLLCLCPLSILTLRITCHESRNIFLFLSSLVLLSMCSQLIICTYLAGISVWVSLYTIYSMISCRTSPYTAPDGGGNPNA